MFVRTVIFSVFFVSVCPIFLEIPAMYAMQTNIAEKAEREPIPGTWIVVSSLAHDFITVSTDHETFFLANDFLAETFTVPLSTGQELEEILIYDVKWQQDPEQKKKWTAKLYVNPDPESGLEKHSKATVSGFVTFWIHGDSGVLIFSDDQLDVEIANLQKMKASTSAFKVYSIYRKSEVLGSRLEFAKKFLKQLSPQGLPLAGEEKRLYGGWEKELETNKRK